MNIGFGEPHAYTGGVAFDVCVDEDVIGTATNAGTPRRMFRLDVTDEWAIDEYLLEATFDFKASTPVNALFGLPPVAFSQIRASSPFIPLPRRKHNEPI